jgi:HEAT repeat protein
VSEEARYRAAAAVDPASPGAAARLLEYLADPSWRVRSVAAERLGRISDPQEAVPGLIEALRSGDGPGARGAAATALAALGGAVLPALLSRLPGAPADVRRALVEVLGEIRDRRAVPALEKLLSDPDESVRTAAAEGLGKLGGPASIQALLGALASTEKPLVLAGLEALERLGVAPPADGLRPLLGDHLLGRPARRLLGFSADPQALRLLADALAAGAGSDRQACLTAVARQRMRRPAAELVPLAHAVRGAVPVSAGWLQEALRSEVRSVAAGAVQVLGWLGDPAAAAAVAAVAADEELRPLAIEALEAMGPAVGPLLRPGMERLHPEVRMMVLGALAREGDAEALAALATAAGGQNEPERTAAFAALAGVGGVAAVAPLEALLDRTDQDTVAAAVAALEVLAARSGAARDEVLARCRARSAEGRPLLLRLLGLVGDAEDFPGLRQGLRSPDPQVRAAAALAFDRLATRGHAAGCLPEWLDALDDPAAPVRAAAARALGSAADPTLAPPGLCDEAVRELAVALRDPEPEVRAAAAGAVGRLRLERHSGDLAELVDDPGSPPEVTAAAVRALGQLGVPDLGVLRRAADHRDPEVVKEALAVAARLPAAAAGGLLAAAAVDPRWDVRTAAAKAMAERRDPALLAEARRLASAEEDPLVAAALAEAVRSMEAAAGRGG